MSVSMTLMHWITVSHIIDSNFCEWREVMNKRLPGQKVRIMEITPFCVNGEGEWIWIGTNPPYLVSRTENKREMRPVQHYQTPPEKINWKSGDIPVNFYPAEPQSLLSEYPLYHFMWPYIAAVHSYLSVVGDDKLVPTDKAVLVFNRCPTEESFSALQYLGNSTLHKMRSIVKQEGGCMSLNNIDRRDALFSIFEGKRPAKTTMPTCYKKGYTVATSFSVLGGRYDVPYGKWFRKLRCSARGCRVLNPGKALTTFIEDIRRFVFRNAMRVFPLQLSALNSPHERKKRLLIIQRGSTRKFLNIKSMISATPQEDWDITVVEMERMTTLEQYKAIIMADVVESVHGSAMAWSLVCQNGTVWIEVAPHGSRKVVGSAKSPVISVNSVGLPKVKTKGKLIMSTDGMEGYGMLVRYSGAHHISWIASDNMTRCPSNSSEIFAGDPLYSWKRCSVFVPPPIQMNFIKQASSNLQHKEHCKYGCYINLDKDWLEAERWATEQLDSN